MESKYNILMVGIVIGFIVGGFTVRMMYTDQSDPPTLKVYPITSVIVNVDRIMFGDGNTILYDEDGTQYRFYGTTKAFNVHCIYNITYSITDGAPRIISIQFAD